MRRSFFTAVMVVFFAFGAKAQQPTTAIQMNDYLVNAIDSLHNAGTNWANLYQEVSQSKEYYRLGSIRQDILVLIDRLSTEISMLQDIGGSEEFRNAIIEFLVFEKSLINDCMSPFESLTASSTQEEIDALFAKLNQITVTENEKLKDINVIQSAFAEKNGFTIGGTNSEYNTDDDYDSESDSDLYDDWDY
jgi:hypothetical protein